MKDLISLALVFLVLALPVSCVKDSKAGDPPPGQDTLPPITMMAVRQMAHLPLTLLESSGIAVVSPNKIWSHEDSGNDAELICIDSSGQQVRTLSITNVTNNDWEDLAQDDLGRIYINDAGNNDNHRKDLAIYRIPNPEAITGSTISAEKISFSFEDQTMFPPPQAERNFDIEALIWCDDSLFLFTKNRSNPLNGICKMYCLPAIPGEHIARLADTINLGSTVYTSRVTSADRHPVTGKLVLLTPMCIYAFTDYPGNRFFRGARTVYTFSGSLGQNEALSFVTKNKLYMTSEGAGSEAGYLFEIILPE